jgi:hypothetical protein
MDTYKEFDINEPLAITSIIGQTNIVKLNFYKGKKHDLELLYQMPHLKAIWFADKSAPLSFNALNNIKPLVSLRLNNQFEQLQKIPLPLLHLSIDGTKLSDFSWLSATDKLKWLSASYNWNAIDDNAVLPNLPNLQILELLTRKLTTLSNLNLPKSIESLFIASNKKLKSLEGLESCTQLKQLDIFKTSINDISFIPTLELTHLTAAGSKVKSLKNWNAPKLLAASFNKTPLKDCSGLTHSTKLERLDLGATKIKDLSPLQFLNHLKYLSLAKCPNITDFSVLQNLTQLEALDVSATSISIAEVEKLVQIPSLKRINLSNTEAIDVKASNKWLITNNMWTDCATYDRHDPFHYTGIKLPSRMFYPLDRLESIGWI